MVAPYFLCSAGFLASIIAAEIIMTPEIPCTATMNGVNPIRPLKLVVPRPISCSCLRQRSSRVSQKPQTRRKIPLIKEKTTAAVGFVIGAIF
jgi:hypothetical protein